MELVAKECKNITTTYPRQPLNKCLHNYTLNFSNHIIFNLKFPN